MNIPWVIKPLWGAISDFVPLFGYRRRTWLVAANLAGIGAFAWVAMLGGGTLLIPALVVTALAMAVSSTLCGALLVETGQKHNGSAAFVNQQWLWFNIAQMISVLTAGWLIEVLSPVGALRASAWIAAVAPLAIIGSVWLIEEERATIDLASLTVTVRRAAVGVSDAEPLSRDGVPVPVLFQPGLRHAAVFPDDGSTAFLAGLHQRAVVDQRGGLDHRRIAASAVLRHISHPALLRLSIVGGVVATLAYLLLSGPVSAVLISIFGGLTSMIAFIATLSLAADSCPEGAEGFAFAGMMSVLNLAEPLGNTLGSVLYQHVFNQYLPPLIVVSAAATGLVFFLVPFMTFRTTREGALAPG